MMKELLSHIARELDFKYEMYLVPDGNFGKRKEDGEWNGMIGEVLKGVRDCTCEVYFNEFKTDGCCHVNFTILYKRDSLTQILTKLNALSLLNLSIAGSTHDNGSIKYQHRQRGSHRFHKTI